MKIRTNLTLNDQLLAKAAVLLEADHYGSLSEYLEQLIRKEWAAQTQQQDRYSDILQQRYVEEMNRRNDGGTQPEGVQ